MGDSSVNSSVCLSRFVSLPQEICSRPMLSTGAGTAARFPRYVRSLSSPPPGNRGSAESSRDVRSIYRRRNGRPQEAQSPQHHPPVHHRPIICAHSSLSEVLNCTTGPYVVVSRRRWPTPPARRLAAAGLHRPPPRRLRDLREVRVEPDPGTARCGGRERLRRLVLAAVPQRWHCRPSPHRGSATPGPLLVGDPRLPRASPVAADACCDSGCTRRNGDPPNARCVKRPATCYYRFACASTLTSFYSLFLHVINLAVCFSRPFFFTPSFKVLIAPSDCIFQQSSSWSYCLFFLSFFISLQRLDPNSSIATGYCIPVH